MLVSETLLKTLIRAAQSADTLGSLPFEWNATEFCFKPKHPRKLAIYKVRYFIAIIYTIFVTIQIMSTWPDVTMFLRLHTIGIVSGLYLSLYTHYVFLSKLDQILAYVNGMVLYERKRNDKNWTTGKGFYRRIIAIAVRFLQLSGFWLSTLFHVDMMINPCLPLHLGGYYIVRDQCKGQLGIDLTPSWTAAEIQQKLFVVFLSYSNWSFLLLGCTFHTALVILITCYCLRSYILLLEHKIKFGFNSGSFLLYRELQIFGIIYRDIYSKYFTAAVIWAVLVFYTVGMYACIKFGFQLSLSMTAMFTILAFDGFFCSFVGYSTLANVFIISRRLLLIKMDRHLSNLGGGYGLSLSSRLLKSCQLIRIYVGDLNYVEESTPLIVQDFAAGQTVNLLLVE